MSVAEPLLQLDGINTYYGQIHILQDSNMTSAWASSSACSAATRRASRRR